MVSHSLNIVSIVSTFSIKMSKYNRQLINEDIVITGMSGRFPESDSTDEFAVNLYNNVDMVTEDERRWPKGLYLIGFKLHLFINYYIQYSIRLIWNEPTNGQIETHRQI